MHPEQYRAYKSGAAKAAFEADLQKKKDAKLVKEAKVENGDNGNGDNHFQPRQMIVNVDNEEYVVHISYPDSDGVFLQSNISQMSQHSQPIAATPNPSPAPASGNVQEVVSPLEGKFFLTKDTSETALKVGDHVKVGDIIGYIESMKTFNAVASDSTGKVVEIVYANGDSVDEDDVLIKLQ